MTCFDRHLTVLLCCFFMCLAVLTKAEIWISQQSSWRLISWYNKLMLSQNWTIVLRFMWRNLLPLLDKMQIFPMQVVLTLFSPWKIPVLCLHYLYPDWYNHKSNCFPKATSFQVCFSYGQEAFILPSVFKKTKKKEKVLFESLYGEDVLKWINSFLILPNT